MAYGKGEQNLLRRAIPTGRTALSADVLPSGKLHDLLLLRKKYLATAELFVDAVFVAEPLSGTLTGEELHAVLTARQKDVTDFNKAYVEKIRLSVPSIISQIETIYFNRLCGRLLHCATLVNQKDPAKRQYLNIPVELQELISFKDLEAFEAKVAKLSYKKVLDLFRDVVINNDTSGVTPAEEIVIRGIHAECLAKYRKPEYGKDPRYTCQIHLDYRVIRNEVPVIPELQKAAAALSATILVDKKNLKYQHFLEISNSIPRGEPIRIPIMMTGAALKRFDTEAAVSSLAIEIGPDAVTVKTVISKKERDPGIDGITHFVARDFGMANTISLSVINLDKPINQETVDRISKFTKKEALDYLQNNSHPNDNIVKRIRFSGRKFLKSINQTCGKIDYLKAQIDTGYNNLEKIKSILCGYYGLEDGEIIPEAEELKNPLVQQLHDKFFRLLKHIQKLKAIRFNLYAKIAAMKKSWFGFLSNQEIIIAKHFNAAIVREDLTILAKEKEAPDYKGRTYNKMINNGSKGQYIRRASHKLLWDGVPEITVPSYYTSTTCTIHSLIDATMRVGEIFKCPLCASAEHSDEHAADTIGNYFLLRPAYPQ